jgi:uncharacterized membrane protein
MSKSEEHREVADNDSGLYKKSLLLLVVGFSILFLGIIITTVASLLSGGNSSAGIVIFIGPIPIILGAGPQKEWLVPISIVVAVVSMMLFLVMRRRTEEMTV